MCGCLHLITKSQESSSEIPCLGAGTNEIFASENHFTFYERKSNCEYVLEQQYCEIVFFSGQQSLLITAPRQKKFYPCCCVIIAVYDFSLSCNFSLRVLFDMIRLLNRNPRFDWCVIQFMSILNGKFSDDDVHKRLFMNFFHGVFIELKIKNR